MINQAQQDLAGKLVLPGHFDHHAPDHDVVLIDREHPDRSKAEDMMQQVFYQAYGARLSSFYPLLLGIRGSEDSFGALAGIRPASQPLFSEHYLPLPVENLLQTRREGIVEIGNLATKRSGQIRWIIAAVTAFLHGAGFSQILFTLVPLLHNSFRRMGLPLRQLAPALAECLPAELAKDWGAYYDCNPAVYAGQIAIGYQAFSKSMTHDPALLAIWQKAFNTGQQTNRILKSAASQ